MGETHCVQIHCMQGRVNRYRETPLIPVVRSFPRDCAVAFVSSVYNQRTLDDALRPHRARVRWFKDFSQSSISDWFSSIPDYTRILVLDSLKDLQQVSTQFLYFVDELYQTVDVE